MRSVFKWLAVNAFIVALHLIAAAVVLGFGLPLVTFFPDAREQWIAGLVLGLLAIAAALGFAFMVSRFISRKPDRHPGRGRA